MSNCRDEYLNGGYIHQQSRDNRGFAHQQSRGFAHITDPDQRIETELLSLYFDTKDKLKEKPERISVFQMIKNLSYHYIYIHCYCKFFYTEEYKRYLLAEKMVELTQKYNPKNE